jgi:HEAT repeat protein
MKQAAIEHEDPWVRRKCLSFLDHHASDESASVFLQALDDPVAPVRDLALHALACEQCRTEELCVAEVTPRIARVLDGDPNPEVRFKAIPILRRLASRDRTALTAIERAAENDADERVREAAAAILRGERPRRWNQFCRTLASQRRGHHE